MPHFNSPVSVQKAARLIQQLQLAQSSDVLDIGCGDGSFLAQTVAASGANGTGFDLSAASIAVAEQANHPHCSFFVADAATHELEPCAYDVVICLGSTHAFGSGDSAYPNAIKAMSQLVRPNGRLLVGEGYWKQSPAADYLAFIGDPVGIYHTHQENIAYAEAQGLTTVYATTSNSDEWDDFEWSHLAESEQAYRQAPADPKRVQQRQGSRQWVDSYLRWGRETMGFGLYIFQK